jgi:adenine-specific DNA-methyltransferase
LSAIHDLINQISDARLRERLAAEWAKLAREKRFGLVFEDHLPELLPLPKARPRRGDLICRRQGPLKDVWQVKSVKDGVVTALRPRDEAHPSEPARATMDSVNFAVDEVMVVLAFGEPIFPSLTPVDAVANGPADSPWHILIEADNYHALQLLGYLYAGKVDCIYIDPPYNTGARDWKYNNDYVDANDAWRHSKWLSMMQRRLRLAKRLLNPADSVLIVTIDEKEVHRLGLLLEQEFPEARVQMVSTMINPANVARAGGFGRSDEYIFFVMFGEAAPERIRLSREWVSAKGRTHTGTIRWDLLRRSGTNAERSHSPGCFYPIYVDPIKKKIEHVGDPLSARESAAPKMKGLVAVLPIRKNGSEGNWQWSPETFKERMAQGRVRVGGNEKSGFVIYILKDGEYAKIQRGEFQEAGRSADGSIIVDDTDASFVTAVPGSQWRISSHDATQYGSRLLGNMLPGRRFPFPKSLYAVEDALRFFVANKPDALILDFFAGSGTTAHAVMRLNRQDGGRRHCILVTNNEVAADEQKALAEQGLQPGDEAWEQWGICRHITFPRLKAAITGKTPEGEPIKGDYKFNDEFPMAEGFAANLAYFKLDFLDKDRVSLKSAFREILPLLWLKAGAVGPRPELARGEPEPVVFAPADSNFVVLLEESRLAMLMEALQGRSGLSHVFIVTDSDESFKAMAAEVREAAEQVHPGLQVIQLYRDYLANFMINQGAAK